VYLIFLLWLASHSLTVLAATFCHNFNVLGLDRGGVLVFMIVSIYDL